MTRVTYEVTATVRPDLVTRYEEWLRRHVPELLATGCFASATVSRSTPGRYRVRYEATDQSAVDRYLAEHAPRLRADALRNFPEGLDLSREIWAVLDQVGR